MKMAAVHRALTGRVEQTVVHTGQHYDWRMSGIFFDELGIPAPEINLDVGSAAHATQTAEIMVGLERVVMGQRPGIVIVYGDVNSTLAAALVCSKLLIPLAHVEAGLRSRDRTMPEEINRIVTDILSDLLFTPSADADVNLASEGIPSSRVHLVGNVMIDTLVRLLPRTDPESVRARLNVRERFVLVTLHRPSNVDDLAVLGPLIRVLAELAETVTVVFPVHPRTRERIGRCGLEIPVSLHLAEPLGYLDFLSLQQAADLVITDSGGIQEETTYLGVPCITVRENTERPITITHGTNVLAGPRPDRIRAETKRILASPRPAFARPPLWDGRAGERIADVIAEYVAARAQPD
jgi:UDP-N-acetylglucosamine 2-epimerase (non-hydrolysing)